MRAELICDEDIVDDVDTEVEEDISSTYLTFDLGDQTLGVEVRHVREIIDRQKITRLPNAPMTVLGGGRRAGCQRADRRPALQAEAVGRRFRR